MVPGFGINGIGPLGFTTGQRKDKTYPKKEKIN
jgi:hypothetical protein